MLFVGNNRGYTSLMMASSGGRKDLNDSPSFGKSEGNQKESAADQTQQIRGGENTQDTPPNPDEGELRRAVGLFMKFQRQQRDHYYEVGLPIATTTKAFLTRFFDPALLGQV